jgi:hypothetical protein
MTMKKFKAWVRLVVTLILLFLVILIIAKNSDNQASLWFFHTYNIAVIWLLIVTSLVSVVGFWIIKGVYRAFKDVRHVEKPDAGQ